MNKYNSIFHVLPKSTLKKSLIGATLVDAFSTAVTVGTISIMYHSDSIGVGTILMSSAGAFPVIFLMFFLKVKAISSGRGLSGLFKKVIDPSENDSKGDDEHDNLY